MIRSTFREISEIAHKFLYVVYGQDIFNTLTVLLLAISTLCLWAFKCVLCNQHQ